MARESFTTHEIAQLCDVHLSSVIRWIDDGLLPAYRTPGGHRRVLHADLLSFLRRHEMPIPPILVKSPTPSRRVLVVDDDPVVRELVSRTIRDLVDGIEVAIAKDGFSAGQQIAIFHPDLVILDIAMPGLDGFEVCRRIKTQAPHTHVLGITGLQSPGIGERFIANGADGCLTKPLNLKALRESVIALLDQPLSGVMA